MTTSQPQHRSTELEVALSDNLDPWTRFFFIPHTVSALLIGVGILVWCSGTFLPEPPNESNYKQAIFAMALVFLGYSALQGPSSVMFRPHPVAWKLVHGMAMLYLLALVFLLMQGKDEARQALKHLDPELGVPLPDRAYGSDCRLWIPGQGVNTEVLYDTLFDVFVIAHSLGWWAKALIMRNYWLLWTCSIGFELMEQTFQHWLANFNECWWDSWILDVALCNLGGLLLGMATVKYFGGKTYNWQGISEQKTILNKASRGLLQFTPYSFEIFDWAVFSSPTRLMQSLLLVAAIMALELNAFFLKTLLWVPPPHPLVIGRLALLAFVGLPAVKEYHEFLNSSKQDVFTKLGANAWLAAAVLTCEILVVIKYGRNEFTTPFPRHVVLAWSTAGAGLAVVLAMWQMYIWINKYHKSATPKMKET